MAGGARQQRRVGIERDGTDVIGDDDLSGSWLVVVVGFDIIGRDIARLAIWLLALNENPVSFCVKHEQYFVFGYGELAGCAGCVVVQCFDQRNVVRLLLS